jgi:hypothetical protein
MAIRLNRVFRWVTRVSLRNLTNLPAFGILHSEVLFVDEVSYRPIPLSGGFYTEYLTVLCIIQHSV